jgi:hypothetical protein
LQAKPDKMIVADEDNLYRIGCHNLLHSPWAIMNCT